MNPLGATWRSNDGPRWPPVVWVVGAVLFVVGFLSGLTTGHKLIREAMGEQPRRASPAERPRGQSAVVEQIKAQVAEIRGLGWEGRLPVHIVSRPELADRLHKAERSDAPERSASDGEILKLLGLIPQDLDYAAARKQLAEAQVVGFYDPDTQEIVVGRGEAALGPRALMAIAHELEHALVDQHFRFGRRLDALHKEGTTRRPSPCSPLWKETPGLSSTPGQTAT